MCLDCGLSERLLYTTLLLLMEMSYLMVLMCRYSGSWARDGEPGLSVEDIANTYYGNRSGTRLEAVARSSMATHIDTKERHHVIAWLKSGATERDYGSRIRPIFAKSCLQGHAPASGLNIPDLSTYAGIRSVANVDTGQSLLTLMKVSYIHRFGVGLVLLGVGLIFHLAVVRPWIKYLSILVPFAAIFADVLAKFLTKWDPVFAYTVVTVGALLGLALAAQIVVSLSQLWILRAIGG